MLDELRRLMEPEEFLAEFGTLEEKRRYVAAKRLEDPNWENTIFPRGKMARGEGWTVNFLGGIIYKHAGSRHRNWMSATQPAKTLKNRRTARS